MSSRNLSSMFMVVPQKVSMAAGRWKIPATVKICGESASSLAMELTVKLLVKKGFETEICSGSCDGDIVLKIASGIADAEGYKLTVSKDGVLIEAATEAGLFYGCATLRDILRSSGKSVSAMKITDAPAFGRRAVYHDTARGKIPRLDTLKGLVDRLAEWKINELQLYVENAFEFKKHPTISDGYSPLTAAELTELKEYCRHRFMKFVPSLASFGHMEKVLTLPKYAHLNELPGGSTLCPTDPASIKFVAELYEDFLPIFDKGDFNVCCDETWDLGKGRTMALCKKVGVGKVYLDFLLKIRKLCNKHGFRMNAWADIVLDHPELLSKAPRDIVMLNWDYAAEGRRIPRTQEIADAGFAFMVCPGTSSWSSMGTQWHNASWNIRNFVAEGKRCGAEGVLNTDWGDGNHRQPLAVSMMGFAFGAAESWNPGAADIDKFHRSFAALAYGGDKALGDAILALGKIDEVAHVESREYGRAPLYYNLDQALEADDNKLLYTNIRRGIDKRPPELIDKILALLPDECVWKIPTDNEFDSLCMTEYAMVARLTALYCLRSSVSWQLGMGQKISKRAMNDLAACMKAVGEDYRQLWLARNKPSRLEDFAKLFNM